MLLHELVLMCYEKYGNVERANITTQYGGGYSGTLAQIPCILSQCRVVSWSCDCEDFRAVIEKEEPDMFAPYIRDVRAYSTGGGFYTFRGLLSDGTWFIADDEIEDSVVIVDSDPSESDPEGDESAWLEEHTIREIYGSSAYRFWWYMLRVVESRRLMPYEELSKRRELIKSLWR